MLASLLTLNLMAAEPATNNYDLKVDLQSGATGPIRRPAAPTRHLADLPPASELVETLSARNGTLSPPPWADTKLPHEVAAVEGAPV